MIARPGGSGGRFAGQFRRQVPRSAMPGLYASSAGTTDDRGQAGMFVGIRLRPGLGRDRASHWPASRRWATRAPLARRPAFLELFQGDHAKVRRLEELICRKMGFDGGLRRQRADLFAQDRFANSGRAVGRGSKRAQDGYRSAAAGASQGSGRTIRVRPDRLVGDGLQAEPDAIGADLFAGAVHYGSGIQRGPNGRSAMAGANAGRQRQSAARCCRRPFWRPTPC